ncbi:uncharacterized protein LOC120124983 [Hibiscus syriacus]|uniref:uncharacterized protein LOC120124983 n=1 Tax=Hibiscus syriacus TaxID=106335 RepID=UPI001922D72E|nr:uncharacterized protein LOC120124983 [Hibiscus syriacus]
MSYANLKHEDIKFVFGDKVFLNVSPWKKVLCFRCRGKLTPRFIVPYEILEIVEPMAYRLALQPELEHIQNAFYVSMLIKYRSNHSHIIPIEQIEVCSYMTYIEEPIKILAKDIKELRNKRIPSVKVLWRNHGVEEATWETDEECNFSILTSST